MGDNTEFVRELVSRIDRYEAVRAGHAVSSSQNGLLRCICMELLDSGGHSPVVILNCLMLSRETVSAATLCARRLA